MGIKKHQHTIPRTYLEKFSHKQDGKAYFVDCLDKSSFSITQNLSVSNICVAKDYYTLTDVPPAEKLKVENFLAEHIENDYNKAYKILVDENIKYINADQRTSIIKTLLSLYFRTPKVFNNFIDFSLKLLTQSKERDVNELDFLGQRIDLRNKTFTTIKKQIREFHKVDFVKTQLELFGQFLLFRGLDGIVVITLTGNQEFITSDNPVLIGDYQGNSLDLFSTSNSIYVPIDPKHCVFIAPPKINSAINQIFRNNDNQMMHAIINHQLFWNCEKWLIGTKFGLSKFYNEYDFYSRPVSPFNPAINEMRMTLQIMEKIYQLQMVWNNTGNPSELVDYLKKMRETEIFSKNASFQKILQQYKDMNLL
jgi:hypothetical protein